MENPSLVTKKIFGGLTFELWNCESFTWDDNFDQEEKLKNFHIEDGDEESYENEVVDEEIFRLFLLVTSPQLYYGFRTVNGCLKNSLEVKGRKRKNWGKKKGGNIDLHIEQLKKDFSKTMTKLEEENINKILKDIS